MTTIALTDPHDRDADEEATNEEPEGERHEGEWRGADEAARRADPFGLDSLGPPSGRPW